MLPPPPTVGGGGVTGGGGVALGSPDRVIKLSSIVDQTLDTAIKILPPSAIRSMFTDYKAKRGAFPNEDIEPTSDQISAVFQILAADAAPYADFAIFGPHGKRLLMKLVFINFTLQPDGSWQKKELPGPPSFELWWQSWRVYRTTLLLVDAADPEHLDNYGEYIRGLHTNYGSECWFLLYTADVRMRSEQFERIRRRLEEAHKAGHVNPMSVKFEPTRPWKAVFAEAIADKSWWDENMRDKALKFLARIKTAAQSISDDTIQPQIQRPSGSAGRQNRGRDLGGALPPQGVKPELGRVKTEMGQGEAIKDANGLYTHNRKGRALCEAFGDNKCGKPGGPCPQNKAHQCAICLGTHSKADHDGVKSGELRPTGSKKKRKRN